MTTHGPTSESSKISDVLRKPLRPARVASNVAAARPELATAAIQRALADPRAASPSDILALQRTYGNRAVQRLLLLQPKLMVGPAGDVYEQEADRVADQVMAPARQPAVQREGEQKDELQMKPLAASITPLVQRQTPDEDEEVRTKRLVQRQTKDEDEESEEELLQTKPLAAHVTPPLQRQSVEEEERELAQAEPLLQRQADDGATAPPIAHGVLHAPGQPLDAATRAFMEPRFGSDFSGVRVHTSPQAAAAARSVRARAYTVGEHVVFGAGEYAPGSEAGKRLLAHELVHTIQQKGGMSNAPPAGLSESSVSATVVQRDDTADLRAFARKARLAAHASVLNDLPETDLKAAVAKMSLSEVNEMLDVVGPTSMHRIRGALLSRMYDDCVQNRRWKEAVGHLNGFDDHGITERVERLKDSLDSRRELIVAALEVPRVLTLIRTATGLAIDEKKPFGDLRTAGFVPKQDGKFADADAGTITIEFDPNPDLISAEEIAFVQTIRRVLTGTNSTMNYRRELDARATKRGTAVDRFGPQKYGWFGYEDSGSPGVKVAKGWCRSNSDKQPSTMTDTPGKVPGTDNTFEACAIAKAGKDTGRVYGCLVWGFSVDDNFGVHPKEIDVKLKTSSEFQAAVKNWNAQADSSGKQEELPPAK